MTIRGVSGYLTATGPYGYKKEADTFTCGHCQKIVTVRPKEPIENMGGRCYVCDTLICPECVKTGTCDPLEKKLKRAEAVKEWY